MTNYGYGGRYICTVMIIEWLWHRDVDRVVIACDQVFGIM